VKYYKILRLYKVWVLKSRIVVWGSANHSGALPPLHECSFTNQTSVNEAFFQMGSKSKKVVTLLQSFLWMTSFF
jgi:hypothetical protein